MKRMMWLVLTVLAVLTMSMVGCAPATTVAPTEPAPTVAPTEPAPTVAPTEPPTEVPAGPRYGGKLVIADKREPSSLSFTNAHLPGFQKLQSLYDSLIRWDQDEMRFVPWLATSWEQESDTTWIFHLREGVQFHRGYGELTAEDVAFSINVIVENSLPSKWMLKGIDHVEVVDRYTVRYHLEYPFVPFFALGVDRIGVLSKAAYEELGQDEFDRNPVGSGPFQFGEWVSGDHLTLRRFEDYWQEGVPYLDEIEFRFVPEAASRLSLLAAGQADMAFDPDFKDVDQLIDDPNINVLEVPGINWHALYLNCFLPPLDSREVRQAIGYAIDREELVEGVYFGHGTPDDDPLPEGVPGASPDQQLYPNTADPEKARDLLAAAGYPDGLTLSFLVWGEREDQVQMAQIIAEQLADVGITVDMQLVDPATYTEIAYHSQSDTPWHMTISSIFLAIADPHTMYWFNHSTQGDWHGWDNPEVDPLLEEGMVVQDFERLEIYRRVVDLILEDAPTVYMMNQNLVAATLADVHGFELSPLSAKRDYSHTWLDR